MNKYPKTKRGQINKLLTGDGRKDIETMVLGPKRKRKF